MPVEESRFDCPVVKQTVTVVIAHERKHMGLPAALVFSSCSGILTCGSECNEPFSVFSSPESCPLREHIN